MFPIFSLKNCLPRLSGGGFFKASPQVSKENLVVIYVLKTVSVIITNFIPINKVIIKENGAH
jgi:hypothetical protein